MQQRDEAVSWDEASMERSKNFVKALQELKSLNSQLYRAADYCEKSYLHNDQKHAVLGNMKIYVVRALVSTVDHLGTAADRLTELVEQQKVANSEIELKISCLRQRVSSCQIYTDSVGLTELRLMGNKIPRHAKHYSLPNCITTPARPQSQAGRHCSVSRGSPAPRTLSWHLAADDNSTSSGSPTPSALPERNSTLSSSNGDFVPTEIAPEARHFMGTIHISSSTDAGSFKAYRSIFRCIRAPDLLVNRKSLDSPENSCLQNHQHFRRPMPCDFRFH